MPFLCLHGKGTHPITSPLRAARTATPHGGGARRQPARPRLLQAGSKRLANLVREAGNQSKSSCRFEPEYHRGNPDRGRVDVCVAVNQEDA
jgi:hypothetical protein